VTAGRAAAHAGAWHAEQLTLHAVESLIRTVRHPYRWELAMRSSMFLSDVIGLGWFGRAAASTAGVSENSP
jgi:hypothetical protein